MSFIDDLDSFWGQASKAIKILQKSDDLLSEVLPEQPESDTEEPETTSSDADDQIPE